MSPRIRAHLAILSANVLFALNYSYSKTVLDGWMSPEGLCIARIATAAILFVTIFLSLIRQKIDRRDIGKLILASLFGIGGNQFIFLQGLNFTSPVDASIIATTGPVIVLTLSALLGRDKITFFKSIGIGIGASGALLVILYGGLANFGAGHLWGNILVFVSAFCYACYLIVVKDLMGKYNPLTVMAWIFGVSALWMTPWLWNDMMAADWANFTPSAWGALAFVIIGATWAAYICVALSLKKLSPTTTSIYSYSQPVLASMFAIVRGQDSLDWVKIFAALLVFTGVFLVTQSYRFEQKNRI